MGTISLQIPDELEAELGRYVEEEHLDQRSAVRKLLIEGLEDWRRERALERLADGRTTVTNAAALVGMSVWDFARVVKERDSTWVSGDHLDEDLEDLRM